MQSSKGKQKKTERSRRREHVAPARVIPEQLRHKDKGLLEELADMVIGPDIEPFGFLLASLDETDKKYLHQLRSVAAVTPNKRAVFQLLKTTEYQKSVIPFTSDENPLGEVAATGIGVIVPDNVWGPDLLQDATDEDNYWQIIDAAQELALNVVFIFIKHQDSKNQQGVCHHKFERLAKGPWPRKQPYVFLMSFWDSFNEEQIEVIKACLAVKEPFQVKVEINRNIHKHKEVKLGTAAWDALDTATATPKETTAPTAVANGKGKEKADAKAPDAESWVEFKRQLLWDNEKQFATFRGEINELKQEVARLKLALEGKEKEKEKEAQKEGGEKGVSHS